MRDCAMKNGKLTRAPALLASIAGVLMSTTMLSPVYADEAPSDSDKIEKVTVTANKRETELQNTGVSVTAIPGQTLEKFDIDNFNDYAPLVPGLTSNYVALNRGIAPVGLRGVATINGTFISGQNTVGFYLDDSPVPLTDPHLVDLKRIEVLRGPQGTLYGSSSLAGTIKLVTQQPIYGEFAAQGHTEVSATEHGGINDTFEGLVNIPLGDNLALRASGYYENDGGYVDFVDINPSLSLVPAPHLGGTETGIRHDDANSSRAFGGRVSLGFSPSDEFQIRASLMFHDAKQDAFNVFMPDLGLVQRAYYENPQSDKFIFGDIVADWNLGAVEIVSATSYYSSKNSTLTDQTPAFSIYFFPSLPEMPAPTYQDNSEWTHETRIVSKWDGPLQGVAGFFYTERENPFGFFLGAQGQPNILGFPIPNDTLFRNDSVRNRREMAVFGEGTYAANDWLTVVGGLRWFDFKFTTFDEFEGPDLLVSGQHITRRAEASDEGVVPRVRVEVRPDDSKLLYASVSEGFRMGGANYPLPATPGCDAALTAFFGSPNLPPSFKSDSLWSYEAGIKSTWLDRRLTLNLAGYFIDWSDTQVPVVLGGTCPFGGLSTNVGAVTSKGFELEAQFVPFKGMTLVGSVANVHARIEEALHFPGAALTLAPAGSELPDIPEWTAAMLAQYEFPIVGDLNGFIRGDWRYQGERHASLTTPSQIKDAYNMVNMRVGVNFGTWETALFVENLTDVEPSLLGQPTPPSSEIADHPIDETLPPRTFGISLRKRY